MTEKRGQIGWMAVVIVVLLAAVGAIYVWQHRKVNSLGSQNQQLHAQVNSLRNANQQLNKQLQSQNPTPASGSSTAASGAVTSCSTAQLEASVATGSHAAGTAYQILKLTNYSSSSCTAYGFPGVSLIDTNSSQLGSPADRNGSFGSLVTLDPGVSVYAAIGFPDPGNFAPGTCSAQSAKLRIYPPGQTTALDISDAQQACPGFSITSLSSTSP